MIYYDLIKTLWSKFGFEPKNRVNKIPSLLRVVYIFCAIFLFSYTLNNQRFESLYLQKHSKD